jgi:hypothetical protein
VKGTKTENPREMPVHPTLARILAAWKLSGFEQLTGRTPRPDDPIVPSRRGAYRNVNASLRRFHEDLERIGLRARRQHDARRTFISIARADGAVADKLHFATHGPDGAIMDDYTTLPWAGAVRRGEQGEDQPPRGQAHRPTDGDHRRRLARARYTARYRRGTPCNVYSKLAERTGLEPG